MDVQQTEKFCDLSGHIVRVNKFAELNNTGHDIPEDFLITLATLCTVYMNLNQSQQ